MTITELMKDVTPDAEYEGFSTANDMVLAIDFTGEAVDPKTYIVAQAGITEQTGTLAAETKESIYLPYRQGDHQNRHLPALLYHDR